MSTIRSSTPGSPQPARAAGFNQNSYYDPFFPSSTDDEQLIQVAAAELSPNPQAHQASLSPALSNVTPAAALTPPQNNYVNGLGPSHYEFLSPNAYLSDNGLTESSEQTGSPEYEDDFYQHLENELSWLPDSDFPGHLDSQAEDQVRDDDEFRDREISDPVSTSTRKSADTNATRTSVGTATLSSHLMSPILTDSASPGSAMGQGSPSADERNLRMEAAANALLNSGGTTEFEVTGSLVQQTTPALTGSSRGTGSSKDTSPDRFTRSEIARAASPVVRIESYSRGDSPARGVGLARAGSKRSHMSSHLAVGQDAETLDDVDMFEVPETHGSQPDSPINSKLQERPLDTPNRVGLDPQARLQVSDEIPNFKDQEANVEAALKVADVEEWLARSEASSEVEGEAALPPQPPEYTSGNKRQRAKSTGDSLSRENLENFRGARYSPTGFHIPGPGLLLDEESEEDDDDDEDHDMSGSDEEDRDVDRPASPPTTVEAINEGTRSGAGYSIPNPASEAPHLYRVKLWEDPLYDSTNPGVKAQPGTSNEAMYKFQQRVVDLETLSRAATWGTRRLSDGDLAGLLHRMSISSREETGEKDKARRRGTFLEQAAAKLRPKRSGSMLKRKESESPRPTSRPTTLEHSKKDSSGSLGLPNPLQRVSSLSKKPKSPRINTGSAVAAMTSVASLGAGASGPVSASATSPPSTPWASAKNAIKRSRSRSELPKGTGSSTNLTELWTKQGGPPMPALAASQIEGPKSTQAEHSEDLDDDDDEGGDGKGVTIDLTIRGDPIVPTLEGFKENVRQLNPRLPLFMIERISQEQLRRYKKLMEFKIKHAQAIRDGKCGSGKHCVVLGGEPTYFQSKSNAKDPEWPQTGFSVAGLGQSDDDANALAEGVVTPAQFPPGVPMPPVKRLPAEFECSLCFKVKKFHKPSDWSKHVHEDVQPFTCTFVNCAEPKSFKRKADWVRHENERHRQLEWWLCNFNDCNHKCYRKDNFVQHLVREHKLPEPKIKTTKTSKPAVRGPSAQKARRQMEEAAEKFPDEIDQVWKLVEECRRETPKNPRDEACKFCGNICNSWKKLTVHLAKHMEQISMPVIGVVEKKDVTPETVISPIEQRMPNQPTMSPLQNAFPHTAPSIPGYGMHSTGMVSPFPPTQSPVVYYHPNMAQGPTIGSFPRDNGTNYHHPQMPSSVPNPGFPTPRVNRYNAASYPSYDTPTTASFMSANGKPRRVSPSPSPDHTYNGMHTTPAAPPHSAPYGQTGPFLPPTRYQHQQHQQQQQYFSTATDSSSYAFAGSPRVPIFPQGAPTSAPMPYNSADQIDFSQASGGSAMYPNSQREAYGY